MRATHFYIVCLCVIVIILGACKRNDDSRLGINDSIKSTDAGEPISISASTRGMFAKGYSWKLSVDPNRKASLSISTFPDETHRDFMVSEAQISELKQVLQDQRFFELKDRYGQIVPDGSRDTLTIRWGNRTRTVVIDFLMNWINSEPKKLQEPARAVRVFNVVRNWFNDADAVDLRQYDKRVLDAAEKASK